MAMIQRQHSRILSSILLVIGAGLFISLLYWTGPHTLMEHIRAAGPVLLLVILFYGLAQMSYAQAWRVLLGEDRHKIPFFKLFGVYLAGDAVNYLIPSGNLAGEPVKAHIFKEELGFLKGLTSVTINKLSETVSMVLFLIVGISWTLWKLSLPPSIRWGTIGILSGTAAAIALFFWRQREGIFGPVLRFLAKLGLKGERFQHWREGAEKLDQEIATFHKMGGRGFGISLLFNLIGWTGGVMEAYWLLTLLQLEVDLSTAFIFESLALIVQNATFFIPGRLGGSDGGRILIFSLLGFAATKGFSFSIMRRMREFFWVGVGLVFLIRHRLKKPS